MEYIIITFLDNTELGWVGSCPHSSLQNLHLCLHFYSPEWTLLTYLFSVSSRKL